MSISPLGIFHKYDSGYKNDKGDGIISGKEFAVDQESFLRDYISVAFPEQKNVLSSMNDSAIKILKRSLIRKLQNTKNPQFRSECAKLLLELVFFVLLKDKNLRSMKPLDNIYFVENSEISVRLGKGFHNDYNVFFWSDFRQNNLLQITLTEQGEVIKLRFAPPDRVPAKEISYALQKIGTALGDDLRIACGFPKLNAADITHQKKVVAESRALLLELAKINSMHQPRLTRADVNKAIEIGQKEYAITRPGEGRAEIIEAYGIGPCVALVLYDPTTKTGMIGHFDETTEIDNSLNAVLSKLNNFGVSPKNLKAKIIGGMSGRASYRSSEKIIYDLRNWLQAQKTPIDEQDILGKRGQVRNIMLDTATGMVYDYNETFQTRKEMEWINFLLQPGPLRFYDKGNGLK